MRVPKFLMLCLCLLMTVAIGAQNDDWFNNMGSNSELSEPMNDLYTIDHNGEIVVVAALDHDQYTAQVLDEYETGVDFDYDKTNRVAFMQVVSIEKKEGKHHYLQAFEDSGNGWLYVYNRSARGKGQLKRFTKRVAKWKVKNRGQRFAHWFNSQFVPTKYFFRAYIGDAKSIDKAVRDAPLFLAQSHLEKVDKGIWRHISTSLQTD